MHSWIVSWGEPNDGGSYITGEEADALAWVERLKASGRSNIEMRCQDDVAVCACGDSIEPTIYGACCVNCAVTNAQTIAQLRERVQELEAIVNGNAKGL